MGKTSKHTPGPWKIIDDNEDYIAITEDYIAITDEEQAFGVCRLEEDASESRASMVANANLIAAAPELLTALDAMIKILASPASINDPDMNLEEDIAVQYALKLIAKARGEAE